MNMKIWIYQKLCELLIEYDNSFNNDFVIYDQEFRTYYKVYDTMLMFNRGLLMENIKQKNKYE
jgi:hypothetical protein